MQCVKPVLLRDKKTLRKFPEGLLVPCGKCTACRIAYRRLWCIRLEHELYYNPDSMFLTLTYDEEHLPPNASLQKRELQKFFKRLRKRISPRKIKYFACGEYGDELDRPHYHSIIFNLGLDRDSKFSVIESWPFCDWNNEKIFKGSFGLVEPYSIQYVASYINKKLSGEMAEEEYTKKNREPVFRIMSNGLGKSFVLEFKDDLLRDKFIRYKNKEMNLPRYYISLLQLSDDAELKQRAIDSDCDFVADTVGVYIQSDVLYHMSDSKMMRSLIERTDNIRKQRSRNIEAKLQLTKSSKF